MGNKKSDLWSYAQEIEKGLDPLSWGKFLRTQISRELATEMLNWRLSDWKDYLAVHVSELEKIGEGVKQTNHFNVPHDVVEMVAECLPEQPWPNGIHKIVAKKLSMTNTEVSRVIKELIRQGRFQAQVDGEIIDPEETLEDGSLSGESEVDKQS